MSHYESDEKEFLKKGVIVWVQDQNRHGEIMRVFSEYGCRWCAGEAPEDFIPPFLPCAVKCYGRCLSFYSSSKKETDSDVLSYDDFMSIFAPEETVVADQQTFDDLFSLLNM